MFGDEDSHVDQAHRLLEPRVNRRIVNATGVPVLENVNEVCAVAPKVTEDLRERPLVEVGVPGFSVGDVGGPERFGAGAVVLEPRRVELIEVEQMSGVLLRGPGAVRPPGEDLRAHSLHLLLEPDGGAPQTLEDRGKEFHRKIEVKPALHPAHAHSTILSPHVGFGNRRSR